VNGGNPVVKRRATRKDDVNKELSFEEFVDKLILNCMDALQQKKFKVTIADLVKMRELRKELAPPQPVTAKVTWIDSWD
jgi:hypothetical protein